ncbi:LysR family transcriptional regulator [Albidovulum sp.]|uniref:LysR family transcriptional regulator n=1 Tax=Albidovulum sp. TaxID=1872424 RepID=UPI001D971CF6|nr:LysR family transcriptional regulator [Paracoccaceae bacterium]MCC0045205.1 LysR family transcriptional regulator [Defluviimonas sp.]MCP5324660.1 LysR family transcriptional regulator [Paracoccaceae bacterium]MCP5354701.1 LysR family transcriptional regulator [Paracoccaceae bacterium]HPE25116.1 LysR family transcriptional regulator [Albidovulum sp.]
MSFENWDEVRTAYQVARLGTVSGAADALGVHHATVIRHIDALEGRLGVRLFQRHPRGYTATEAGQELLKVARTTDDQFAQLAARIAGAGSEFSGELVVTSLPGLSRLITPVLIALQAEHPGLRVRYVTDPRVFRLEYGEAHVAIRAGGRPQEPDNVVQPLFVQKVALFGTEAYREAHGFPGAAEEIGGHRFVGPEDPDSRAPFHRWLLAQTTADKVVFRTNELAARIEAIRGGNALGFLTLNEASGVDGLIQVLPPRDDWDVALWIVTHVDLHRSAKIQAFLGALKEHARSCANC